MISVFESIRVRLASFEDAAKLPAVEQSAAEAFRATVHAHIAEELPSAVEEYRALIANGGLYVAALGPKLVGFVATLVLADTLHIQELAVRYEFQRQGIGRALLAAARVAAADQKLAAMTLTTFSDVPFNAEFYRRLGFRIIDMPPAHLSAILTAEANSGLFNRCAMRLEL